MGRPSKPKTFTEAVMRDCCRHITGDPKQGTDQYCAGARRAGSPYCDKHHAACFVPVRKKEKAAA